MENNISPSARLATEMLGARLDTDGEKPKEKRPYHRKKAWQLQPHQWKKGQSGNPKGRPVKNLSIVSLIKERLESHPEEAETIALALINLAKDKNLWAIESVMNRIDGKVIEQHRIEGELPVRIEFIPAHILLNKDRDVIEGQAREIRQLEESSAQS